MADYATLLRDHVTLTCRSVDRIFLQAYVPRLQSVGRGVSSFCTVIRSPPHRTTTPPGTGVEWGACIALWACWFRAGSCRC
jgi:hypothetical protein